MKYSRNSTCRDWLTMNWRTTIALQKISSAKNISAKRLPRKKRTAVLLRQAHDFGNRIEIRRLRTGAS
jgi:hypothetical protein